MKFVSYEPHSHLSMLMCKEFSRIVCVSLFSYQGYLSCDSFAILTCCLLFVKNFLISFFKLLQHSFFSTAFRVYHNSFALSRIFLLSFLKKERRRRDLNPRAAINDLLPFQGSPFGQLGYFSKLPYLLSSSDIYLSVVLSDRWYYISYLLCCQVLF